MPQKHTSKKESHSRWEPQTPSVHREGTITQHFFSDTMWKKILFSSHCGVQCNILGSNLAQDLWNTICSEFPLFLKEIIPSKTSQAWQKTAVTKAFITNVCLHFGPCSDLICKLPVHPVTYHFLWVCKRRCKCVNECVCVYTLCLYIFVGTNSTYGDIFWDSKCGFGVRVTTRLWLGLG